MKNKQIKLTTWMGEVIDAGYEKAFAEIPEAWHPVVSKLFDDMYEAGWNGEVHQIKEKFGGLRLYIGDSNQEINDLIDDAERKTQSICIICGEPATGTTKGWYTHRCDKHMDT